MDSKSKVFYDLFKTEEKKLNTNLKAERKTLIKELNQVQNKLIKLIPGLDEVSDLLSTDDSILDIVKVSKHAINTKTYHYGDRINLSDKALAAAKSIIKLTKITK